MHDVDMEIGAPGVILGHVKDPNLTWTRMLCEFIDNSLDARSRTIEITKRGDTVEIADDGLGCPEPKKLVNLGGSYRHSADCSGYFGIGGKVSGIRASRGTRVEYTTTHGDATHSVVADWGRMIETNRLVFSIESGPRAPGDNGTRVKIFNCLKFKDLDKVQRDLGFYYAESIAGGLKIRFKVDGKPSTVKAYQHPPFVSEVKFEFRFTFDSQEIPVHGYCGLVEPGSPNPHKGWVIHWGPHQRVLGSPCHEPAMGRSVARIHGHVYLPTSYRNHNLTKDDFSEFPEDLFTLIGEHCAEIIEAADQAAEDFEVESFTESVAVAINSALPPRVKGRRPGPHQEEGATEATGNGPPHRQFGTYQPGDKGRPRQPEGSGMRPYPYPFKIDFLDDMESPWEIGISQSRRSPSWVKLDKTNPMLWGFKERGDVEGMKAFAIALICQHLARYPGLQKHFGAVEELDAYQWFERFSRTQSPEPVEV